MHTDKNGQVQIIDFGACYIKGIAEITSPLVHGTPLGTADYFAPETYCCMALIIKPIRFTRADYPYFIVVFTFKLNSLKTANTIF
ncbi:hypothetical protein ACVBIL_09570 [Shewanella sp. 125m-7]